MCFRIRCSPRQTQPKVCRPGQYRLRHASDDGGFTTHSEADWFQFAVRGVHDTHGVFHRYKLVTILFTAAEAGQDQCLLAGDEMTAIEFVDTCTVSRQRRRPSATTLTSGVAERKFPPRATNTFRGHRAWREWIAPRPTGFGWWSKTNSYQRLKKCRRGVGGILWYGRLARYCARAQGSVGARFTNVTA